MKSRIIFIKLQNIKDGREGLVHKQLVEAYG